MTSAAPAAARSRRIVEDRPGCPSPYHGTRVDYEDYGCRCPDSEAAYRAGIRETGRRAKLRAAGFGHLAPRRNVPATGATRRLQALAATGYTAREVAAIVHASPRNIGRLLTGEPAALGRELNERITHAYNSLPPRPKDTHPPRLAEEVACHGWKPPAYWECADIDDPAVVAPKDLRRCTVCNTPLVPHHWRGPVPDGCARHRGRGLCRKHYEAAGRDGTRDEFALLRRDADRVLDAWVVFREEGASVHEAAEALDMTYDVLRSMLQRARKRGDVRGATPYRPLEMAS